MIIGEQIRASRAMLKWTAEDLAKKSSIGVATIRRLEAMNGIPTGQARILDSIQKTLEEAGIEFMGTPDRQPGVRLK